MKSANEAGVNTWAGLVHDSGGGGDAEKEAVAKSKYKTLHEAAETRVFGGSRAERLIPPRDVAAAVQYLASPGAGKVNGQGLVISGGGA